MTQKSKILTLPPGKAHDIIEGLRDGLLLIPLYLPLALVYASIAAEAGFSPFETVLWSAVIFAGTAQIASANILIVGGGFFEVMIVTLLTNLRHGLVSLSLAPYLRGADRKRLPIFGFLMITPLIGLIPNKVKRGGSVEIYWLTTAFCQFALWISFTLLGVCLGRTLPAGFWDKGGFTFAATAVYIGLVMPLVLSRPKTSVVVTLTACVLGVGLCTCMSPGLSIIVAAVGSALVGLLVKE